MTHASDEGSPEWQRMDEMSKYDLRGSRSGSGAVKASDNREPGILDMLDQCFVTADQVFDVARNLEERLEFVLQPEMERGENKPLDTLPARSAMISRIADLDRRLRQIRDHIVLTTERVTL